MHSKSKLPLHTRHNLLNASRLGRILVAIFLTFIALARVFIFAGTISSADSQSLQSLKDLENHAPTDQDDLRTTTKFAQMVIHLVEKNGLKKGPDFFRAAKLIPPLDFRTARVRYELLLVAAANENQEAERLLPEAWDALLIALGRPMRTDAGGLLAETNGFDMLQLNPAPKCIQAVLRNPSQARSEAVKIKDNLEMQKIIDDDQAARKNLDSNTDLTDEQAKALASEDRKRNLRTRQIIDAGELRTSKDFANASLVMQHSANFSGYEVAHELAVCSMLLGDRATGRWLVAATYDRMLGSVGEDQRFGTQYNSAGLMRVDEEGICDAERLALGCPALAVARLSDLADQADSLQQEGMLSEAEAIEKRIVEVVRNDGDDKSSALGDYLTKLAITLNQEAKFKEAEAAAREAIQQREKFYPVGSWQIASSRSQLGVSLFGQKKYTEAEPILLSAFSDLKKSESAIPDKFKVRIRETATSLVQLYEATDRAKKAGEWQQEISGLGKEKTIHP